jgi:hypothetical protein
MTVGSFWSTVGLRVAATATQSAAKGASCAMAVARKYGLTQGTRQRARVTPAPRKGSQWPPSRGRRGRLPSARHLQHDPGRLVSTVTASNTLPGPRRENGTHRICRADSWACRRWGRSCQGRACSRSAGTDFPLAHRRPLGSHRLPKLQVTPRGPLAARARTRAA